MPPPSMIYNSDTRSARVQLGQLSQRTPLKRSFDMLELGLDIERVVPFTTSFSRIQELDESTSLTQDHSTLNSASSQMGSTPYMSSSPPSAFFSEPSSPAFSTPLIRSDISPRKKPSTSGSELIQGRSEGYGAKRLKTAGWHPAKLIKRPSLREVTRGIASTRLGSSPLARRLQGYRMNTPTSVTTSS